jgi:FG-GAP-like repeat/ASPIC and UnbV
MNMPVRVIITGLLCVGLAAGGISLVLWAVAPDQQTGYRPRRSQPSARATSASGGVPASGRETGKRSDSDPDFLNRDKIEDGGFGVASSFSGSIGNHQSLTELRDAIRARGQVGLAVLRSECERLRLGPQTPPEQLGHAGRLFYQRGLLEMYEGHFSDATAAFERALEIGRTAEIPVKVRSDLLALLGIVAMRRGEVDNCIGCVGPASCIFPLVHEAVHTQQAGSREAVTRFTAYLDEWPGDLRIRWLLNLAYMTLGEYPDHVPRKHLIPLDTFQSKLDVGRFQNVAPQVGLIARGPNLAGGSVFDDFTGDSLPDLFITAIDAEVGASLFVNRGDGTFEDRSRSAGLDDQVYALNVARADYDNDGRLDVLLLRGAWENPMRLSLLQNKGDGRFEDMTIAAGLAEPISTESAAWGDYDNDGRVDVFVCGEYLPPSGDSGGVTPDPRNRCRLYHNQGNGSFVDVAAAAGVVNEQCGKGSAWGDYDGDGRLDLYVSNMNGPCRLYRNLGDGKFEDVAPKLDVLGADVSFACWFWDFDNDGRLDIYVNENDTSLAETAAIALGKKVEKSGRPRLYRNLGVDGFRDVTRDVGLDRAMAPMGCNFGDIDNDGYLDFYLGTGWMSYSGLVPNLMFKNIDGRRFEDITASSGTGHLQKGHGISFADWDGDGDLDLFVEAGGAVPGDKSYNLLFNNPGHGRHWLKVKLVGTKTNRAALGAAIRVDLKEADGATRSIYRTIGNNSSFGGNSLVELIGLGNTTQVAELSVSWPTSKITQTFRIIQADQAIEITEGSDSFKTLRQPPLKLSGPTR